MAVVRGGSEFLSEQGADILLDIFIHLDERRPRAFETFVGEFLRRSSFNKANPTSWIDTDTAQNWIPQFAMFAIAQVAWAIITATPPRPIFSQQQGVMFT